MSMRAFYPLLITPLLVALLSVNSLAVDMPDDALDKREQQLADIRTQIAQFESEKRVNAATIAAAPPGQNGRALQKRAVEINRKIEELRRKEIKLQK
jgi:hypothetical protein